jgi:hypothetical protein
MTQEEFNNLKIGDKVKFHCFRSYRFRMIS